MPRGAGGSQGNGNGKDFEMLKEPFQSPASASSLWAFRCVPEPVSLLPCKRGRTQHLKAFGGECLASRRQYKILGLHPSSSLTEEA